MSTSQVLLPRKVDASKVTFGDDKEEMSVKGVYSISFSYGNEKALIVQTPKMFVPFGLSEGMNENGKFAVELSFSGENTSETDPKLQKEAKRMKEFRKCIGDLNDALVDAVHKHPEWLNKPKKGSKELVSVSKEELTTKQLSSSIRVSKDEEKAYDDRFKCSIPCKDGRKQSYVEFTDSETGKSLDWDDVNGTKMFSAICIVRITGAWVSTGLKKFGFFIKLAHMQVTPSAIKPLTIQTYDSDEESDDDSDGDEVVESDIDEDDLA
jgi:hypothetical protein